MHQNFNYIKTRMPLKEIKTSQRWALCWRIKMLSIMYLFSNFKVKQKEKGKGHDTRPRNLMALAGVAGVPSGRFRLLKAALCLPIHSQFYRGCSAWAGQLLTHSPGCEVNKTSSDGKMCFLTFIFVSGCIYWLFADSNNLEWKPFPRQFWLRRACGLSQTLQTFIRKRWDELCHWNPHWGL